MPISASTPISTSTRKEALFRWLPVVAVLGVAWVIVHYLEQGVVSVPAELEESRSAPATEPTKPAAVVSNTAEDVTEVVPVVLRPVVERPRSANEDLPAALPPLPSVPAGLLARSPPGPPVPATPSTLPEWPAPTGEFAMGDVRLDVENRGHVAAMVGIRQGSRGKDLSVQAQSTRSIWLNRGVYSLYYSHLLTNERGIEKSRLDLTGTDLVSASIIISLD